MTGAIQKQGVIFIGIVYTFLFSFACIFYFERLNSDAGYYFFQTVNKQWFHVEHGRFVLILSELLAVIGSALHLPLKIVALLYSLNHVIFPALLTFICIRKFNDMNAALLLTMMQFAGLRYAVYTPQFELFYGLDILVLALSFIRYKQSIAQKWNIKDCVLYALMMVFILTSHPMAVVICCASLLLFFRGKQFRQVYIITGIALLIYAILKKIYISEYEQGKFTNLTNAINRDFVTHYLNLAFVKKGFLFLLRHYTDALLIFLAGIFYFIKTRNYLSLIAFIVILKIVILVNWMMFEPGNMGRYIEQVYFPFVFLACVWLFDSKPSRWVVYCLSLAFVYRLFLIINSSVAYKERTAQMAQFAEKAQTQTGTKFYLTEAQMGKEMYDKGNWSYGFETLIYSSIHYKKSVTITKLEDLEYNDNIHHLKPSDFLFRPFEIVQINSLNTQYFKLIPGDYDLLNTP